MSRRHLAAEATPPRANVARQLLAAARYRPGLVAQPPPALVLSGAGDALVDPACSHALAAALGAQVRQHPTGGHDLPLDDGPWVAAQVAEWVARCTL